VKSKEQSYYVVVRKSCDVVYKVSAYSFQQASVLWEQEGDEQDIDPISPIVISISLDEES
jgi:hypothetical protein